MAARTSSSRGVNRAASAPLPARKGGSPRSISPPPEICSKTSASMTTASSLTSLSNATRSAGSCAFPAIAIPRSFRRICSSLAATAGSAQQIATASVEVLLPSNLRRRPGACLGNRSLTDDHLELGCGASAYQSQIDGAAHALRAEQTHHFTHPLDSVAVPGCYDIADKDSGAGRWPIWVHTDHKHAAARSLRRTGCAMAPQGLETSAEITPEHMAPGEQLIDRAVDRCARYGEHAAPRSEHRHADDASLHIDDRAALSG